jgi:hypothetical protein
MGKRAFCVLSIGGLLLGVWVTAASAQQPANQLSETEKSAYSRMTGLPDWMSIAGYADFGYRTTQFFKPDYDTTFFQGDGRLEFWIPPGRDTFSWGPYLRLAGVTGDRPEAWQNAWLALPGAGFQAYPFSLAPWREDNDWIAGLLGPLRLFVEYNRQNYHNDEGWQRPEEQGRAGAEYWKALYVNDTTKPLWGEIWSGLFWQSANEFDPHYNTVIFANALRAGVRVPDAGILSLFTPYGLLESSLTDNGAYYWENRLLLGFGIRVAPWLRYKPGTWLNRFVLYAEYLHVADYYHTRASSDVPDHDFRVGINLAIGDWYR